MDVYNKRYEKLSKYTSDDDFEDCWRLWCGVICSAGKFHHTDGTVGKLWTGDTWLCWKISFLACRGGGAQYATDGPKSAVWIGVAIWCCSLTLKASNLLGGELDGFRSLFRNSDTCWWFSAFYKICIIFIRKTVNIEKMVNLYGTIIMYKK